MKLKRCSLARQQVATATSGSDWWKGRRRPVAQREGLHFCVSRPCSMGCCPDNISAHCQFVQPAGPLGSAAGLSVFNGGSGGETKAFSWWWWWGGSVSTQGQCGPVVPFPEYTQLSHAASKHTFLREEQIHELSPNGSIFFFFFLLGSRKIILGEGTHTGVTKHKCLL